MHIYQPNRVPGALITSLPIETLEGARDFQRTLAVNVVGPLFLSVALFEKGLLTSRPIDATAHTPSNGSVRPQEPTSSISDPSMAHYNQQHSTPAPTSLPPSIVHMGSAQQSLTWATELWHGGSERTDQFFHPAYSVSKVALSGLTAHLARVLKVSIPADEQA